MGLNQWFEKGLSSEEYINLLEYHEDHFKTVYQNFSVPEDHTFFSSLQKKNVRAIVLAEVWCGHCMLNIPVLLRLAEKVNMPVRFLNRDENLELMDQYLTNGNRTIPIFIFIDQKGNEIAKWGPMAPKTREFVSQYRDKLPPKDDDLYDEKFKEMIKITTKEFTENEDLWIGAYESMKDLLAE